MKKFKIKEAMLKLKSTGFFSIFISNVFAKIVTFFGSIILVRFLSKSDYGIYAYILNVISILCLLNDFGASNAALQYMTEKNNNNQKQKTFLLYSIKIAYFAVLLSGLLILFSPYFYPYTIETAKKFVPFLCLIPALNAINNLIPVILRANLENTKYAKLQFGVTIINYAVLLPMTIIFGLIGAVLSQYIYSIISLIYGLILCKKFILEFRKISVIPEKKEEKSFFRFAIVTQLSNTIGGILIIVDTFLIGLLIADSEIIATYKVASAIPQALTFLPTCVVIYVLPYFIKNNKNKKWLIDNYNKLTKYGLIIYGIISISLILCSKFIFTILYGDKYMNAIPAFIILIIGFFFSSTFKIPSANITYALRKIKYNLIINICSIVMNFILNIIFINWLGFIGAAITTMLISMTSSILYRMYIKRIFKNIESYEDKH